MEKNPVIPDKLYKNYKSRPDHPKKSFRIQKAKKIVPNFHKPC